MSSCRGVGIVAAAIVGYSLGALTGSGTVAWAVAVVAGAGTYLWLRRAARRTGATCASGCGVPRSRQRRGSVAPAPVDLEAGPFVAVRRGDMVGTGADSDAVVEPGQAAGRSPRVTRSPAPTASGRRPQS